MCLFCHDVQTSRIYPQNHVRSRSIKYIIIFSKMLVQLVPLFQGCTLRNPMCRYGYSPSMVPSNPVQLTWQHSWRSYRSISEPCNWRAQHLFKAQQGYKCLKQLFRPYLTPSYIMILYGIYYIILYLIILMLGMGPGPHLRPCRSAQAVVTAKGGCILAIPLGEMGRSWLLFVLPQAITGP